MIRVWFLASLIGLPLDFRVACLACVLAAVGLGAWCKHPLWAAVGGGIVAVLVSFLMLATSGGFFGLELFVAMFAVGGAVVGGVAGGVAWLVERRRTR